MIPNSELPAQTYYRAHRDKGQSHACAALRPPPSGPALAQNPPRHDRSGKPCDEGLHLKNMTAHGSWNLKLNSA